MNIGIMSNSYLLVFSNNIDISNFFEDLRHITQDFESLGDNIQDFEIYVSFVLLDQTLEITCIFFQKTYYVFSLTFQKLNGNTTLWLLRIKSSYRFDIDQTMVFGIIDFKNDFFLCF